ncbi:hypothetical protein GF376_05030 [Candidatus Peregrinibacteria bacterium]|nr:hypothetical protein [Candidatus Peregrinibacteria bacterium]
MKQKNKFKVKVHPLIITLNLVIILIFGNAIGINGEQIAFAEPEELVVTDPQTGIEYYSGEENPCQKELPKYAEKRLADFQEYLEIHFANKSSTSSLLDEAIIAYEEFKNDIYVQLQKYQQPPYINTRDAELIKQGRILFACQQNAEEYIEKASTMLQMRAETTSQIKRSTAFLEKYKQINSKMRDLNLNALKFSVHLTTFDQKLPCYLANCI